MAASRNIFGLNDNFQCQKIFLSFFDGKGKIRYFIQILWMEEAYYLNLRDFSSRQIHTTDYTMLKALADFRFMLWQKKDMHFPTHYHRVKKSRAGECLDYVFVCVLRGHWEIGRKWNKMIWKITDSSLRFSTLSTTSLTAPWPKCKEDWCPLEDEIGSASQITPSILPSQDMDMDSKGFKNCIVCVGWYNLRLTYLSWYYNWTYIEYITSYIL